jgi:hypothetical protein
LIQKISPRFLCSATPGLLPAGWSGRVVRPFIRAVHPFRDETVILMPDKNFRDMPTRAVIFGQFDRRTECLRFAGKTRCNMAIGILYLPFTIMVDYDVSGFAQSFLQLLMRRYVITRRRCVRFTGRVSALKSDFPVELLSFEWPAASDPRTRSVVRGEGRDP